MESDFEEFSDAHEHLSEDDLVAINSTSRSDIDQADVTDTGFHDAISAQEEKKHSTASGSSHFEENSNDTRSKFESQLSAEELERRKTEALCKKETGNTLFRESAYSEALQEYSDALDLCPLIYEKERSILFSNRSACHSKLGDLDAALLDCDKALELDTKYVRCLQRRAVLREEKDQLAEALKDYQCLLELDPGNEKARWACATLPDRIKKQQEEMKAKMMDQLKQLGNMVLKPFGLSTDNFQVQKNPDSEGYSINFVR